MLHKPQQTLVSIIRTYVEHWRRRESWSREEVAAVIVQNHYEIDAHEKTGIVFNPATTDVAIRLRLSADRLFRWLDDQKKSIHLLPTNFIYSVLIALPEDLRQRCVDEIVRPLGLVSRSVEAVPAPGVRQNFRALLEEDERAHSAYLALAAGGGALSIDDLLTSLNASIDSKLAIRRVLDATMANMNNARPVSSFL